MLTNNMIDVLLVDPYAILRDGIASMLAQAEGIKVVGSVSSGEEAVCSLDKYKPHIVLMDVMMKGMSGFEATRCIKEQDSNIKVIIISSEIKKEFISEGIKYGIDGYLSKNTDKATLIDALRTVSRGEKYFDQAVTMLIFENFYQEREKLRPKKSAAHSLTKRENEVLELVANCKSNKEVADLLFISVKTVETHKSNVFGKLNLRNTAELVRYAIKNNVIHLD